MPEPKLRITKAWIRAQKFRVKDRIDQLKNLTTHQICLIIKAKIAGWEVSQNREFDNLDDSQLRTELVMIVTKLILDECFPDSLLE